MAYEIIPYIVGQCNPPPSKNHTTQSCFIAQMPSKFLPVLPFQLHLRSLTAFVTTMSTWIPMSQSVPLIAEIRPLRKVQKTTQIVDGSEILRSPPRMY